MIFDDYPLPPTSNNIHATILVHGQMRRINSKEYKLFLKNCQIWAARNNPRVQLLKKLCVEAISKGRMIAIDSYFVFTHEQIWTQKNKPKKLDASNRLKGLHDSIALLLDIDDSMFWQGTFEKTEGIHEKTILHFKLIDPRKAVDVTALLRTTSYA